MEIKFKEKAEDSNPRQPKKKDRTMEKMIIGYFILASIVLVAWNHTLFYAVYLKYIKGQNITYINGKIIDLDTLPRQKKIIIIDERTGRTYQQEQYLQKQEEKKKTAEEYMEENKRRIAELDANIAKEIQRRERQKETQRKAQKIECWIDDQGKKIYTNMEPPGREFKPCQ